MTEDFRHADEIYHIDGIGRRDTLVRFENRVIWYEWPEDSEGVALPIPVSDSSNQFQTTDDARHALSRQVEEHKKSIEREWQAYRAKRIAKDGISVLPSLSSYGFNGIVKRYRFAES